MHFNYCDLFVTTYNNDMENTRQRIPKGQPKKDNPEKLATRRRKTKQNNNTICVGHHYIQANINNVNKI